MTGPWDEFESINVGGTENVLDAPATHGVGRLVHVSSPSVAHVGDPLVGRRGRPGRPRARPRPLRAQQGDGRAAGSGRGAVTSSRSWPCAPTSCGGPGDTQLVGRDRGAGRAGRLVLIDGGAALIDTTYVDNAADALVAALDRVDDVSGEAFVVSNGEPRTVAELLTRICRAAGVPEPTRSVPRASRVRRRRRRRAGVGGSGRDDEPPMTRFLAEQLSTAHWFDQRRTREALQWTPTVSLAEGFARLAAHIQRQTATLTSQDG